MTFITASICLSDIPKERMTKAANGKTYANIIIGSKDEDQYGNNVYISMSQSKEERESGQKKTYIGNGKDRDGGVKQQPAQQTPPQQQSQPTSFEQSDLPF